jgi:hypothetical protein
MCAALLCATLAALTDTSGWLAGWLAGWLGGQAIEEFGTPSVRRALLWQELRGIRPLSETDAATRIQARQVRAGGRAGVCVREGGRHRGTPHHTTPHHTTALIGCGACLACGSLARSVRSLNTVSA